MSDAATEFAKSFETPGRYVIKSRVPIFYAHKKEVLDPETKKKVVKEVTEAELTEWLENLQAHEQATGAAGVLRLGHIDPEAEELNQPLVGGYIRNPVLDRFGPEKRLGILVDEYAKAECVEALKELPCRSVEMYRPSKRISAVAALARDPQLPELGYVTYSRAGERLECYSLETNAMDPNVDPMAAAATPPAAPAIDIESIIAAVVKAVVPAIMAELKAKPDKKPDNLEEEEETKVTPPAKGPENMNANQTPELYALQTELTRQKRANEATHARLAQIEKERDAERVERMIAELRADNYSFDAAEEREALLELPTEAARQKYLGRVRKNYPQMPAGRLEIYSGPVEPGSEAAKQEAADRAKTKKAYALMNANPGMTMPEALAKVS